MYSCNGIGNGPTSVLPVYFFLHIPKTAGQTIRIHLARYCPEGTFLHVRPPGVSDVLMGRRYHLDGLSNPGRIQALAGHDLACSLERHFPDRVIRRIVLLRDPIDLQFSLYNFRMMSNLGRGVGTFSFDLHLDATPPNFISHRLLHRWLEIPWPVLLTMSDARKYEILNEALSQFWFVGSHYFCDEVIASVAPDLGLPLKAEPRNTARDWHAQVPWRTVTLDDLSTRTRRRLYTRNRLDLALWESWRNAGFDIAGIRPVPFQRDWERGLSRYSEAIRPIYLAAVTWRRDLCRFSYIGQASRVARADQAREIRDWRRAAILYGKALKWRSTPAIWIQYANALWQSGDLDASLEAQREALRLKPDNCHALVQLGIMLFQLGRKEEAARQFLRALERAPDFALARESLLSMGWTEENIDSALTVSTTSDGF